MRQVKVLRISNSSGTQALTLTHMNNPNHSNTSFVGVSQEPGTRDQKRDNRNSTGFSRTSTARVSDVCLVPPAVTGHTSCGVGLLLVSEVEHRAGAGRDMARPERPGSRQVPWRRKTGLFTASQRTQKLVVVKRFQASAGMQFSQYSVL